MQRPWWIMLLAGWFVSVALAAPRAGFDMDYGPFQAYTVLLPNEAVTKAVTVSLRAGTNVAAVVFDTETLRYAAGWTGGGLDLGKTHLTSYKGELAPRPAGRITFQTPAGPGWAKDQRWEDPRENGLGPLPRDWAHYRGLYRHGSNVVFRYTVGGVDVLDMPGLAESESGVVFTRTLRVADTAVPLQMRLPAGPPGGQTVFGVGSGITTVALNLSEVPRDVPPVAGFPEVGRGGPARWGPPLVTSGRRGADTAAFAVDTVTLPERNPWNSWMRLTGLDFFSDGRAAVTTWNGDVWIVSGLDDGLRQVRWQRFATGLFDPLGLRIRHDELFVLERHQITRLQDLNGDGEADWHENFNHDAGVSPSYHAFAMDLQTDAAGNFYYARAGQRVDDKYPLNGGLVRVSADGARAELIAHGLRAANGLGVGPHGEIVCSDNQGNWIPSSRLNLIQPGGFYGYVPHAHTAVPPTNQMPPLCWIPMALDNSGGGQVFVTGAGWPAALSNHLLHTSYGMAALFDVLWERVDGVAQGGVVRFPLQFDSGIQRARFHPRDGQLWVAGLKGWQTKGVKDGALQRLRATGRPLLRPVGLHVRRGGLEVIFSDPLQPAAATDVQNWSIEQWNYRWTEKYGSDDFSVAAPEKKGRDRVEVQAATLSADGRSVFLALPALQPVMQMKIKFACTAASGAPVVGEIYNTIHRVPR